MKIIREICGACPQDVVVELDSGERYNFYVRHGGARLYDESGTELLVTKDVSRWGDGILQYDDLERVIVEMAAEYRGNQTECPHCGGAL